MTLRGRAALLLLAQVVAASALVAGCGSDPSCADVDSLERKLGSMSPDDPDFNGVNEDLELAQADCNAGGGGY